MCAPSDTLAPLNRDSLPPPRPGRACVRHAAGLAVGVLSLPGRLAVGPLRRRSGSRRGDGLPWYKASRRCDSPRCGFAVCVGAGADVGVRHMEATRLTHTHTRVCVGTDEVETHTQLCVCVRTRLTHTHRCVCVAQMEATRLTHTHS